MICMSDLGLIIIITPHCAPSPANIVLKGLVCLMCVCAILLSLVSTKIMMSGLPALSLFMTVGLLEISHNPPALCATILKERMYK